MQRILITDPTGSLEEVRVALEMSAFNVVSADDVDAAAMLADGIDIIIIEDALAPTLLEQLGVERPYVVVVGESVPGATATLPAPPDPGRIVELSMELASQGPPDVDPFEASRESTSADFDPASMLDDDDDDDDDADLDALLGGLTPVDPVDPDDEVTPTPPPSGPIPEALPDLQPSLDVEGEETAAVPELEAASGKVDPDDKPTRLQPKETGTPPVEEDWETTSPDIWALDEPHEDEPELPTEERPIPVLDEDGAPMPQAPMSQPDAFPDDSPTRIMSIPDLPPGSGSEEEEVALRLAQAEFSSAPEIGEVDEDVAALFADLRLPAIQVTVTEAPPESVTTSPGKIDGGTLPTGDDWDQPTVKSAESEPASSNTSSLGLDPSTLGDTADRIERAVLRYAGYAPLQSIPEVFGRLVSDRETGTLLLRQGDLVKSISFIQGAPVFATSSQRTDRLGEVLYRAAMLTREQLDSALKEVNKTGQSLGKVLLTQGVLSPHDLFGALRKQVLEIIYSIFAWRRGEFSFLTGEPSTEDRFPLPLPPAGVVMEGIRRGWTLPEVLERFGGQDRVPIPSATKYYAPEDLDLSDLEAKVPGAVDGRRTLRNLLSNFAGSEEVAARVLYALLCVCALRMDDEESTQADEPSVPSAPVVTGAAAQRAPVPQSTGVPDVNELKRRIRAKHEQIQNESYFAILGVPEDGLEVDITAAYQKLEKAFRPQRFGAPEFEDVRGLIEQIHKAVREAFEVLGDPQLRENYRRGLHK